MYAAAPCDLGAEREVEGSAIARRLRNQDKLVHWSRVAMIGLVLVVGMLEVSTAASWFTTWRWVIPSGRIAILGATGFESAWGLARVASRGRASDNALQIDKTLVSVLVTVSKEVEVDVDVPGCNVWSIYQPRGRAAALYRAGGRRLSEYPQRSQVTWTKGKGLIGRCWEEGEPQFRDWTTLQRQHPATQEVTERAWKKMGQPARWGFERQEYLRSIHKYQQILAVPIKDEHGRVLGCVSLDIPVDRPANSINTGAVREVLARAAETLRYLI